MTRRDFLATSAFGIASIQLPFYADHSLKFAVITDIHHGLAPDSYVRLQAFVEAVHARDDLDFVLQMGDFCHSWPPSEYSPFLKLWHSIKLPKHHILGNHDMDRGSKADAMKVWGMPSRYGRFDYGDWRFLYLDLNHYRKDGKLFDYEKGNYFTDNAVSNMADPEQLEWLATELRTEKPTILLSHQPLGFKEPGQDYPEEQKPILDMVAGKVAFSMFGHLHVDRIEKVGETPFMCLNSASYFWQSGMHPYRDPLFAFVEISSSGMLSVTGRQSIFSKGKPETKTIGCSASIDNRIIRTAR
ncbi:hypothetical protein BH11ARM1_BH11ARM1_15880 [soil metagenome]